ncbi:MAG: sigma-70 family RNA polymerase sigma factor [Candidatus Latescibacteria bacterium]|nr:sigma-70 family RNA polymerase sigma factor [Candidatus Latescibacterota bacterium]
MAREDEEDLLDRSLEGDGGAFGQLVDRHQKVLFNVALRMVGDPEDAKDITQVVFLKAYENLGAFDRRHKFFSWIYRIMINESLNHIHRAKRHEPLDERMPCHGAGPEEDCERSEVSDSIHTALAGMSPDYRQVIILRHFIQLSYQEMSELLEVPEKTVKSRLHTARQLLGEMLSKKGVGRS